MNENTLMKNIQIYASHQGARLFRNNVGKGWIGKEEVYTKEARIFVTPGDVIIRKARRFHSGLCVGSSDLIGWKPVEITQDMVGSTIAVFTGIEVKTEKGRPTKEQKNFIRVVEKAGGLATVCRSVPEAGEFLLNTLPNN